MIEIRTFSKYMMATIDNMTDDQNNDEPMTRQEAIETIQHEIPDHYGVMVDWAIEAGSTMPHDEMQYLADGYIQNYTMQDYQEEITA